MVIKLQCPQPLDMEAFIKNNPFKSGENLKKDSLHFIIHCIMVQRANKDDEQLKRKGKIDGYVPLHSLILQSKIPHYHKYIDYLIRTDVIECDEKYIGGKISKGYRLAKAFRGNQFKRVEITDFTLCRKIAKDKPFHKKSEAVIAFPYLAKWFKTGKLEIDETSAIDWINEYEAQELQVLNNNKLSPKNRIEAKELLFEKCGNFKILASRIADKDFFFHKDEFGNRLHTNLTNLPKGLRQFITYDGHQLVSVDIKNSQPYMSLPLLGKEFWQSKDLPEKPTLKRISRETYRETRKNKTERHNTIMFIDSSKTLVQLDFQKQEFIKNVANGTFYEYLVDVFENKEGLKLGNTPEEKRSKVKKMVLTLLFDDDSKGYNKQANSASQIFKKAFPTVAQVFGYVKRSSHRNLAMILQRIESYLLLDRVCSRIAKERPWIPIFTIHDAIITTEGNEDFVQQVMKEELEKSIGKAPKFSTESWQKNQYSIRAVAA